MVVTGELTALGAAYRTVFVGALIFLALMVLLCLIRAVKGPSVADRIVAVNMMGTMVMVVIAMLAVYMGVYRENENTKGERENGCH